MKTLGKLKALELLELELIKSKRATLEAERRLLSVLEEALNLRDQAFYRKLLKRYKLSEESGLLRIESDGTVKLANGENE